eukprot:scaffold26276_cov55-Attheya_sp.AAC.3
MGTNLWRTPYNRCRLRTWIAKFKQKDRGSIIAGTYERFYPRWKSRGRPLLLTDVRTHIIRLFIVHPFQSSARYYQWGAHVIL